MGSAFDDDFATASDSFAEVFADEVTLQRGANTTADVPASLTGQGAEIQTQTRMGVKTSFIDREWLVKKSDYVIDSSAVTPAAGDRLIDSDGAKWELMSQPNMPAWESLAGGLEWLLRTKRIASA